MKADGTERRKIAAGYDPAWEPHGDHILMIQYEPRVEIYMINADGTDRRQLTNDRFPDRDPFWLTTR